MTNTNRRRFPILLASALALLAILGALFLPDRAQAQAQTIVLVSNIDQPVHSISKPNPVNRNYAVQFTTGGNTGGYNLDSVELSVGNYENVRATVSLYSDSSGVPGLSIFTFTNPTSGITANANNTFAAPANTTLMASTPYHIVVSGANDPDESTNEWRLTATGSNAEDSGGATNSEGTPDWAIADDGSSYSFGAWGTTSSAIQIRVNGSAASDEDEDDPPLSTDATLSALSLGTGVTLSPAFASGTVTYTASVANSVDEVTVTPTTNHASATVEILDTDDDELDDADDMDDDFQVALSVGDTVIKVKVTAEDGTSTQTYTVTVTRAPASCTLNTGDLWCGVMTVGEFSLGPTGGTGRGYRFGQTGSLSDDEFPFDGDTPYRVQAVYYVSEASSDSLSAGTLALTIDQGIPDRVTLQLGNEQFPISNASSQSGTSIYWSGSGLNWSVGDQVTLRLSGEAPPTVTVADATATEGDAVEFVVTLSAVSGRDVMVDYATSETDPQSAVSGTDFTSTSGTLTIAAADNTATGTIEVPTTEDDASESAETFTLTLSNPTNATLGTPSAATGTINDDATCTLNTGDVWCGVVTVGTFTIGGTPHFGYLDGTGGGGMLSDNDFGFTDTDLDSASHTITGVLLASGTLSLVFNDSQDEDDKPVLNTWDLQVAQGGSTGTFALGDDDVTQLPTGGYQWSGTGLSWSVGDTVTLRLRGESGPPSVASVAVTSIPLLTSSGGSEPDTYGAGDKIEFTVTFSRAVNVTGDPEFGFSLSGARQADYDSGSGSTALKFVYTVQSSDSDDDGIWIGNHNSTTKSLQLDSNDEITSPGGIDANLEHDQLQVQAGHKVDGSRSSKPTLSVADAAATEGSNVSFSVTLSAAAATTVTATWTASIETGDTAVAADLGATKTGMVTVAIGDTDETFTVATVEDTTVEVNETFTVTLSGVSSNAQLSSTAATAQGTINNDDLATVSVADAEGDEDEGVEFTLTLSAAAPADVTVDWTASIESGDSASTADLATTKTGTVTITKGATTKKFTVPVNDDSTDEPDQTFTVTLSNPTPTSLAQLAADPTATGTIEDDDGPPTLTVEDVEHDEDAGESRVTITVSLSEVSEKRVRFRLRQVDRTGDTASDADFIALSSGTNSINVGIMSITRDVVVAIVNDTLDEDDETLTVEAYSLQNATGSASDKEATITIIDDDPTPTVTVADAAATEGDKVEFVVTLSAVSGRDVDVDYATSVATGDDATSGTDFTAASGTLTIAAADNIATGTIEVQTTEDDASESAETFTLTISSPDNATLTTDTTATGTINNRATTAAEPTTFAAAVGNAQVVLSWDAPDSASGVTRHEYQYKEGTGAYQGWVPIANSGVDGANEAGFTVTGLTNEVLHTFQLRAVNAQGESTAAEADPVTPTPGICGRTQRVHEIIVYYLGEGGVERTCAEVNVADLESFTISLDMSGESIGSLKSGDFAGLSNLISLVLPRNTFTTLPANVFSGLTSLTNLQLPTGALSSLDAQAFSGLTALKVLNLSDNDLDSLPGTVFSGLTALETLELNDNDLETLPAGLFSGLAALTTLKLNDNGLDSLPANVFSDLSALEELELQDNDLSSLPAGVFSGLAALTTLTLNDNDLNSLDAGVFSGLSALEVLNLNDNDLSSLPAGLFSGLTAVTALKVAGNTVDPLPLTVTVEKVGTDQARAKVLTGAPFAVDFAATVANGSLPTGVTKLAVAKGSVEGTAVTVTRTTGTMAAVTVDIDLTTQPTLPTDHLGYEFVKAASGLPATILPDTRGPQNFTAKPGDGQAVLSWTAPASGSGVTKHQYRQKEGSGSYPANWTDIPNSAEGGANEDGYTVPDLTNETAYTFELKRFVGTTESATAESNAVTPTPGICDRTQQVQDGILAAVAGVDECEAVTVANLAGIGDLDVINTGITSVQLGDFAGLTGLQELSLKENSSLTALPSGVFSGLTALAVLSLDGNALETLPAGLFSGLTRLVALELGGNADDPLPLTVTVEKVGTDRVRAKVLAGAPFAVAITVAPEHGTLAGGVTALNVAKGAVEGTAVTVTRTEGTTDAVTVDVDLTTSRPCPRSTRATPSPGPRACRRRSCRRRRRWSRRPASRPRLATGRRFSPGPRPRRIRASRATSTATGRTGAGGTGRTSPTAGRARPTQPGTR